MKYIVVTMIIVHQKNSVYIPIITLRNKTMSEQNQVLTTRVVAFQLHYIMNIVKKSNKHVELKSEK